MTSPTHFHAMLSCSACGELAEHELVYAGRLLAKTTCSACGHREHHQPGDLPTAYLADLEQRVLSKPARMVRRLRANPVTFLTGIPLAAVRKPLRIAAELKQAVFPSRPG